MRRCALRHWVLAAVMACPAQAGTHSAPSPCLTERFSITPLPFRPAALNARGEVAGTDHLHHAVLWTARGGVVQLPLPAGFDVADALSLDGSRRVLAVAADRTATRHGPMSSPSAHHGPARRADTRPPDGPVGPEIAGEALLAGHGRPDPVVWDGGEPSVLGGCCGGSARDMNSSGAVVGDSYDPQGRYHAFLWTPGGGLRLIGPPDQYSSAVAINDARRRSWSRASHRNYRYDGHARAALSSRPDIPAIRAPSILAASSSDHSVRIPTPTAPSAGIRWRVSSI